MGGTRSTAVSPLHLHPLIVLPLLMARMTHQFKYKQEDLSCLNDYMGYVNCVWSCSNQSEKANHQCILRGTIKQFSGKENVTCEMMSLSQDHCYKGCHFQFKNQVYSSVNTAMLEIKCAGELMRHFEYKFAKHIKLQAPGIPSITQGNLSWSLGTHVPKYMTDFIFERQFKREDEPWEVARGQTHKQRIEHLEPLLHLGVRYQARVRVMPEMTERQDSYGGTWSEWSPILTWTSDVGDPLPTPLPQHTGLSLSYLTIGLLCGAVFLVMVMILCFNRKGCCCSSFILKKQHVPDPSQYFQPLHAVHGGDFQKWLRPVFGSEAFSAVQSCDSISPVEVAPTLPTETCQTLDPLMPLQGKSSGAWTGSGQSSCYSNMGYFYSEFKPGRLHIESCPIYFTYPLEADENVPEAGTGTRGTSYERLEQIQQIPFSVAGLISRQGEPLSPELGFRIEASETGGVNGEEDMLEEEECKRGKEERPFTVHLPNVGLPFPIQTPLSFLKTEAHAQEREDTIPPLPCSYTPSPPEGNLPRSASFVIQPCDGGYMTVNQMQNTYSNKSI